MNWFDIICLWIGRISIASFTLMICWLLCDLKGDDGDDKGWHF